MTNSPTTKPDLTAIFAHIDAHRQDYLDRLFTYLRQPSISAHGLGIAETAEHIAGVMRPLGLEPRIIPTSGWPMVLGERNERAGAPTVILYGHYDVQPPDPLDLWDSPPFEPTIRDGKIYARGVGDNKGQHFAQILGIEATLAVLGTLPCNVKVLLEGEEEIGSPRMPEFIREHRDELTADLVITADGPTHESGQGTLHFGVRGVLSFELRARGANHDLHSGNWGGIAPNPIWTLIHLLGTMKNDQGTVTIDGFYDNVQPLTPLEREALEALPVDMPKIKRELDLDALDAPADRGFFERLSAWPTFTINGFHAGYGGPGSKTVLPHEAYVKCDIRLVESQTADEIFAKAEAHIRKYGPNVAIVRQGSMDPSKTPIESVYTAPLVGAITAAQGVPLLVPALGGSLPDYVFTKILGIPAFGTPYANADEANHAPNENLEIERFYNGIKTGAAVLAYLGAMEPAGE